jgi:hypothetical protein
VAKCELTAEPQVDTPGPVASSRALGRLGHGHSLPGPWPRRPRPFQPASASPMRRFGDTSLLMGRKPAYISGFRPINLGGSLDGEGLGGVEEASGPQDGG